MKPEETVQIVDRQNRKTLQLPRSLMRSRRLTHRACYILVFNDRHQLFLQKRTRSKDIYPGYWDVAAGGVVLADESYEESAARELAEELGVTGTPLGFLFDHYFADQSNCVWGRIFACRHNGPFLLQESEVESGMFIAVDEALRLSGREPFTPDGVEILRRYTGKRYPPPDGTLFLHGLDSSGQGTKGRYFAENFPHVRRPDFTGSLAERLARLTEICRTQERLTLIGSSFGGLMATCYAIRHPGAVDRLILLAPALNFPEFHPPGEKLSIPCLLVIGSRDTVTPPDLVVPRAEGTFANLEICLADDDHLLHQSFSNLAWSSLLSCPAQAGPFALPK